MSTLNEILTKNCLRYKNIKNCSECRFFQDCKGKNVNSLIIAGVKEWLQQKQKTHVCDDFCCISHLLEELEQ